MKCCSGVDRNHRSGVKSKSHRTHDGYRSVFTNTISVRAPTDKSVAQLEACRDAMAAAAAMLKARVACRDLRQAASAVLESRGFRPLAQHAGHGLALEHHDSRVLVSESDDTLIAGDVITLERGRYTEGHRGIRFEHNYLITADGSEQLSQHHIGLTM